MKQQWRSYDKRARTRGRLLFLGNNDNNSLNGNNNINNNARFVGITLHAKTMLMKTYGHLWDGLCSYENLEIAYKKARKHKTKKQYVLEFEKNLEENLLQLRAELRSQAYQPAPLKTFILRDPKTRKISKSEFRDRIVHHALCNVIEPIFDARFIHDSYANRKGKGVLKAIQRFDCFKRKVTKNNTKNTFVLKADIKHYFDRVDHVVLISMLKKRIVDEKALWLIETILENYRSEISQKGMPIGNLTSQFFANVYLNELDQYVKNQLKAKYYLRYVDDFVILGNSRRMLEEHKQHINDFLKKNLKLELHPDKSQVRPIQRGIMFLGFRLFSHHSLLKKNNIRQMNNRLLFFPQLFKNSVLSYDEIYASFEGWLAYASQGNTHRLRKKFIKRFHDLFPGLIADVEISHWLKSFSARPQFQSL
ncbi:MAG: reverse transcriptase domain-containing protein [Nanoarchaeota archaeon]